MEEAARRGCRRQSADRAVAAAQEARARRRTAHQVLRHGANARNPNTHSPPTPAPDATPSQPGFRPRVAQRCERIEREVESTQLLYRCSRGRSRAHDLPPPAVVATGRQICVGTRSAVVAMLQAGRDGVETTKLLAEPAVATATRASKTGSRERKDDVALAEPAVATLQYDSCSCLKIMILTNSGF